MARRSDSTLRFQDLRRIECRQLAKILSHSCSRCRPLNGSSRETSIASSSHGLAGQSRHSARSRQTYDSSACRHKERTAHLIANAASSLKASAGLKERVLRKIANSLDLRSSQTGLCKVHELLNEDLVDSTLELVKNETLQHTQDLAKHVSRRTPVWIEELVASLRHFNALWLQPADYDIAYPDYPDSVWAYEDSKCAACILARIGGCLAAVQNLRKSVIGRLRKRHAKPLKEPRLLRLLEEWEVLLTGQLDQRVDDKGLELQKIRRAEERGESLDDSKADELLPIAMKRVSMSTSNNSSIGCEKEFVPQGLSPRPPSYTHPQMSQVSTAMPCTWSSHWDWADEIRSQAAEVEEASPIEQLEVRPIQEAERRHVHFEAPNLNELSAYERSYVQNSGAASGPSFTIYVDESGEVPFDEFLEGDTNDEVFAAPKPEMAEIMSLGPSLRCTSLSSSSDLRDLEEALADMHTWETDDADYTSEEGDAASTDDNSSEHGRETTGDQELLTADYDFYNCPSPARPSYTFQSNQGADRDDAASIRSSEFYYNPAVDPRDTTTDHSSKTDYASPEDYYPRIGNPGRRASAKENDGDDASGEEAETDPAQREQRRRQRASKLYGREWDKMYNRSSFRAWLNS